MSLFTILCFIYFVERQISGDETCFCYQLLYCLYDMVECLTDAFPLENVN